MYVEYQKLFYTIQKITRTFLIITCHALNHSEIADASTYIKHSLFFDAILLARTISNSVLPYILYTVSKFSGHYFLIFKYFIIYVDSVNYLRRIIQSSNIKLSTYIEISIVKIL